MDQNGLTWLQASGGALAEVTISGKGGSAPAFAAIIGKFETPISPKGRTEPACVGSGRALLSGPIAVNGMGEENSSTQ